MGCSNHVSRFSRLSNTEIGYSYLSVSRNIHTQRYGDISVRGRRSRQDEYRYLKTGREPKNETKTAKETQETEMAICLTRPIWPG